MSEKKNRPTPKRKEAQAKRIRPSLAPASTKEEKQRAKAAAREARQRQREAFMRGDENAMPSRDRGPARRYVRNYIDSRRTVSEFVIPLTFVVLFVSLIPTPIWKPLNTSYSAAFGLVVMYSFIISSALEAIVLSRRIKRAVAEKFPDTVTKGLGLYGWMRATQIRRTRMPRPQVKVGERNF